MNLFSQTIARLAPKEFKAGPTNWQLYLAESLIDSFQGVSDQSHLSDADFDLLGGAGAFAPDDSPKTRGRLYRNLVRYQIAWGIQDRLAERGKLTLEELGHELGVSKNWATGWRRNQVNAEQMGLALTSKHVGNNRLEIGKDDRDVQLALTLGYLHLVRLRLSDLNQSTSAEVDDLQAAIPRRDFDVLELLFAGATTEDINNIQLGKTINGRRVRIAEASSTMVDDIQKVKDRWMRSYCIAVKMAHGWSRQIVDNNRGSENE